MKIEKIENTNAVPQFIGSVNEAFDGEHSEPAAAPVEKKSQIGNSIIYHTRYS